MVEGKNVYLDRGNVQRMGFFTTRWIEAFSEEGAANMAIDLVKQELRAVSGMRNDPSDPPIYTVEKIQEIDSFEGFNAPGRGFSFYEDPASAS
jgi:hypothetical protein